MTAQSEPDLSHLGVIEGELADVATALERLDDGTYGTCEVCREALVDEVLEVSPAARRCSQHQVAADA